MHGVPEKNSSRKPGEQARLPTPRYRIGMRAYGYGFPRIHLLGNSVNRGNPPLTLLGASLLALCSITHTTGAHRQESLFMRELERWYRRAGLTSPAFSVGGLAYETRIFSSCGSCTN